MILRQFNLYVHFQENKESTLERIIKLITHYLGSRECYTLLEESLGEVSLYICLFLEYFVILSYFWTQT
jgi:hypothetical protein